MSDKKDFRVFEVDGVEYKVIKPNLEVMNEAMRLRSNTFIETLQNGGLLRDQLDNELRKRNLWNDDLEIQYQTLRTEIIDMTTNLRKGGIKLGDAKDLALEIAAKRQQMVSMLTARTSLDSHTCEGKADAAKFNYMFSACLVYNDTDKPYFENGLIDYLINMESPVASAGATEFYYLITDTNDPTDEQIENQFLKKYKFVDDNYRLVDKDGKLVDADGRHVDEDGYFIQWLEDGSSIRVTSDGKPVDEDGYVSVEFMPFLDNDGNPVEDKSVSKAKPKKTTKRTTKKKTSTATKKRASKKTETSDS